MMLPIMLLVLVMECALVVSTAHSAFVVGSSSFTPSRSITMLRATTSKKNKGAGWKMPDPAEHDVDERLLKIKTTVTHTTPLLMRHMHGGYPGFSFLLEAMNPRNNEQSPSASASNNKNSNNSNKFNQWTFPTLSTKSPSSTTNNEKSSLPDISSVFDQSLDDSSSSSSSSLLQTTMDKAEAVWDRIQSNVVGGGSGPVGERGEVFVAAQLTLLICVLAGGVPVLGDVLTSLLGPGLLLAGLALIALSIQGLDDRLSPWIVPVDFEENNTSTSSVSSSSSSALKTSGVYELMRHPMYAGLIAACVGLSIVTDSVPRLLLTVGLAFLLEIKTQQEETLLIQRFPSDYVEYQESVPSKFIPMPILTFIAARAAGKDEPPSSSPSS